MSTTQRSEFKNVGPGILGVVLFDEEGKRSGGVVKPDETIWLSEREEVATANSHKEDKDNPFANGSLVLVTRATEVISRRPIGSREAIGPTAPSPSDPASNDTAPAPEVQDPKTGETVPPEGTPPREERPAVREETAAPPLPEGDPERGIRAPGEEVGTPEVVRQASVAARAATEAPKPPEAPKNVTTASPVARKAPEGPQSVVVGPGGAQYQAVPAGDAA